LVHGAVEAVLAESRELDGQIEAVQEPVSEGSEHVFVKLGRAPDGNFSAIWRSG
jgi:hypothetical protein